MGEMLLESSIELVAGLLRIFTSGVVSLPMSKHKVVNAFVCRVSVKRTYRLRNIAAK